MAKQLLWEISYYVVLILGYGWSVIELFSGQPFDAFVLFIVTFSFHTYRSKVLEELE